MDGLDLADLDAFTTVAGARGFRGAAALRGVSASGLSEAVRRLEERLGVRLLNRTTRSVIPTDAGARLLERLTPALREVASALDAVSGFRERPAGTLKHACIRHRFASGRILPWEFERGSEIVRIAPSGPLVSTTLELEVGAAIAGLGLIYGFEEELADALGDGRLEPVLTDWWQSFSGPFLYYPSRTLMPAPLRAFVDFLKQKVTK